MAKSRRRKTGSKKDPFDGDYRARWLARQKRLDTIGFSSYLRAQRKRALHVPRVVSYPKRPRDPSFYQSKLRGISVGAVYNRAAAAARIVRSPVSTVIRVLKRELVPCELQHIRRRILFAAGVGGAKWSDRKGPNMHNKQSHGCNRR